MILSREYSQTKQDQDKCKPSSAATRRPGESLNNSILGK